MRRERPDAFSRVNQLTRRLTGAVDVIAGTTSVRRRWLRLDSRVSGGRGGEAAVILLSPLVGNTDRSREVRYAVDLEDIQEINRGSLTSGLVVSYSIRSPV